MNDYYLEPSSRKEKKWMVHYINPDTNKINTIHFGQKNFEDYTQHKNKDRRDKYEKRHSNMGEDWNDPQSGAGFWAYNLLWTYPNFKKAIKETEKKYNIKIHIVK